MNLEQLQSRVTALEAIVKRHEAAIAQEKQINALQANMLKARIANQAAHQKWLEIPVLAMLAFVAVLVICVLSIQVQFQGFSFIPGETVLRAIETPAIAAIATAVATALLKKFEANKKD